MNYDQEYYYSRWNRLTDAEKHELSQNWDTQEGEGFPIALMALARLVISHCRELRIGHANVGIYHGGTFLLKVSLAKSCDLTNLRDLPREFEGFPVIWVNYKNEWVGGFRMGG